MVDQPSGDLLVKQGALLTPYGHRSLEGGG